MCVPIVIDVPQGLPDTGIPLTDEEKARLSQSGTKAYVGDAPPDAATTNTNTAKPAGGVVNESGQDASQKTGAELATANAQVSANDAQGVQNTLVTALAQQAAATSATTAGILQAQTDAATALKDGFMSLTDQQSKALKAADELRKNTGQASRKPNYSVSLKANAKANSTGLSSTMLTGSGGVATNALTLGRPALLGGA